MKYSPQLSIGAFKEMLEFGILNEAILRGIDRRKNIV
jgi:hypothetical protein